MTIHGTARALRSAVFAALLMGGSAHATTLVATDVPTLSRTSDAIVHATVKKVSSRWTGDHLRIVTDVELDVTDTLKGAPVKSVKVVQPGGVVGDIGQRVDGLATFEPGEEVVVFLASRPGGTYLVSGMAQGKFKVERSSDGKAAFAVPTSVGEAQVLDPVTRQPIVPSAKVLKLEELKASVRAAGPAVQPAPRAPIEKQSP